MLYKKTVDARTLALIQQLMDITDLKTFRLVGGTALLSFFTMKEMLTYYHNKFPNSDEYIPLRSLIYFEDAEDDNLLKNIKKI